MRSSATGTLENATTKSIKVEQKHCNLVSKLFDRKSIEITFKEDDILNYIRNR